MTVLILPSWYPRHPDSVRGSFFRDQAFAVRDHGHHVVVIAVELFSALKLVRAALAHVPLVGFELDDGIPTYRVLLPNPFPKLKRASAFMAWLITMAIYALWRLRNPKPDVIHAHAAICAGWTASKLGKCTGIPVVLTEHMSGYARNRLTHVEICLAREAFRFADAIIFVSQALRAAVNRALGSNMTTARIIPNVLSRRFTSDLLRNESVQSDEGPVFVNVASLDTNKNHAGLLKAFGLVLDTLPSARLLIVGDGAEYFCLAALVEELRLGGRVRLLGRRPPRAVPRILARSDVFVLSSVHETFGVAVIEALACGLPVVTTRSGGPEHIVSERDGVVVDPGSVELLAAGMVQVASNLDRFPPDELRRRALERFGPERIAGEITEVYRQVVHSGQRTK